MATRAPKSASRPTGSAAGRARPTGSSSRARGGSSSGGARGGSVRRSSGRGPARPGSGSAGRRGGTPYYRSTYPQSKRGAAGGLRASSNPFLILLGWILAAIATIWMELARGVGSVARLFGDSARELDPAHRRDGVGLAVLAAAIITAGAAWWHLGSPFGRALTAVVRGAFGVGAWTIPILLTLLAWRLLRHPDKNAHAGRMIIGWTALLAGALGIAHIALGSPAPSAGRHAMQTSGGMIGYAISAPLRALLTTWAAVPLLALVAAFGVLVITGTPLHRVRERFAEFAFLVRQLRGVAEEQIEGGEPADQLSPPRLGRRKNAGAIEAGENDRPYDTPLLGGLVPRGSANRTGSPAQASAGPPGES